MPLFIMPNFILVILLTSRLIREMEESLRRGWTLITYCPINVGRSEALAGRRDHWGRREPEKAGKIVPSIVLFIALKNAVTGRDRQCCVMA